jgi:carbon storage regulator
MLILSRSAGQGIRIGDSIRVTVVSVDGKFVRLGIEAPRSSKVLRDELWCAVAEDNQSAAASEAVSHAFAHVREALEVREVGPEREEG